MVRALCLSSSFGVPGKLWMGALAFEYAIFGRCNWGSLAEESSMTEQISVKVGEQELETVT